jgi:hypothetical protein
VETEKGAHRGNCIMYALKNMESANILSGTCLRELSLILY